MEKQMAARQAKARSLSRLGRDRLGIAREFARRTISQAYGSASPHDRRRCWFTFSKTL